MADPRTGVVTVTLNAAVDVVYAVDGYRLGEQHRSTGEAWVPGGKGNNVARTVRALGGAPVATGFVAGATGDLIERGLAARGIETAFIRTGGESRICFSVLDERTCTLTEIYPARGAVVDPVHLAALEARLSGLARGAGWIVISGSLPAGVPPDYYGRLVGKVQAAGARAVLDSGPAALAAALPARPWGLKCNAAEAADLFGEPVEDLAGAMRATAAMRAAGAGLACVTRGPAEAVLRLGDAVVVGRPPRVEAVSAVGSGDALLGGLVLALARRESAATALRWGLAAGAANALRLGTGAVDPAEWRRLLPLADVRDATDAERVAGGGAA